MLRYTFLHNAHYKQFQCIYKKSISRCWTHRSFHKCRFDAISTLLWIEIRWAKKKKKFQKFPLHKYHSQLFKCSCTIARTHNNRNVNRVFITMAQMSDACWILIPTIDCPHFECTSFLRYHFAGFSIENVVQCWVHCVDRLFYKFALFVCVCVCSSWNTTTESSCSMR